MDSYSVSDTCNNTQDCILASLSLSICLERQTVEITIQLFTDVLSLSLHTGYESEIRGFPRYFMNMEPSTGVYNFQIKNILLEDEGDYQCQVREAYSFVLSLFSMCNVLYTLFLYHLFVVFVYV